MMLRVRFTATAITMRLDLRLATEQVQSVLIDYSILPIYYNV